MENLTNQQLADYMLVRYQELGAAWAVAASRKSQLSAEGQDAFEAVRGGFISNRVAARMFTNTYVPDATIASGAC